MEGIINVKAELGMCYQYTVVMKMKQTKINVQSVT